MVLVPEKFNFWAFGFGPFWLLWNRLYLAFAGWIALFSAFIATVVFLGLPLIALQLAIYGLSFMIGLEGNELRRRRLKKRGFALVDIASGANSEEAERRFLSRREISDTRQNASPAAASTGVSRHDAPLTPIGGLM